jgi:hypothetical protein
VSQLLLVSHAGKLPIRQLFDDLAAPVVASAAIVATTWPLYAEVRDQPTLVALGICTVVGLAVYAGILRALFPASLAAVVRLSSRVWR